MTSEAVLREPSAPILNRIACWQMLALGLGGWVALYSSATFNFQKGLAELAGHAQGICFAGVMTLSGAEARKRKRERDRKEKLHDAFKWVDEMSDTRFEKQLSIYFHRLDYRLESIKDANRAKGFCLRVVRDGRTTLVHNGLWRASNVDEETLAKLAEGSDIKSLAADRVLLLTKAEVSEVTKKRMSSRFWNLVSGMDFVAMTREFPLFAAEASSPHDATDKKQDIGPDGTERFCKASRTMKRKKGFRYLFDIPFHHNLTRRFVRQKR